MIILWPIQRAYLIYKQSMNKLLPFLLFGSLTMANCAFATEETPKQDTTNANEDIIYVRVAKKAEFDGGIPALTKYLTENLRYPEEAAEKGLEGKAIVNFIVNKDGSISDVTIAKSAGELFDAEAIRVVSEMPKWIPGEDHGIKVRCRFALPINFSTGVQNTNK